MGSHGRAGLWHPGCVSWLLPCPDSETWRFGWVWRCRALGVLVTGRARAFSHNQCCLVHFSANIPPTFHSQFDSQPYGSPISIRFCHQHVSARQAKDPARHPAPNDQRRKLTSTLQPAPNYPRNFNPASCSSACALRPALVCGRVTRPSRPTKIARCPRVILAARSV